MPARLYYCVADMAKRILLVDDEIRLAHLVRGYLERDGYEVATAGNGREALQIGRAHV